MKKPILPPSSTDLYAIGQIPAGDESYSVGKSVPSWTTGECDPDYADCPNSPKKHGPKFIEPETYDLCTSSPKPKDLLWTLYTVAIKEEFAQTIAKRGFSGIDFRPLRLYRGSRRKVPVDGYVEMRITGRVRIDEEASGISRKFQCPLCGVIMYSSWNANKGLHFEGSQSEWPDVFKMAQENTLYRFAKREFVELLIELELTPLVITPIEAMKPFSWKSK
jgi:hypothetical protein